MIKKWFVGWLLCIMLVTSCNTVPEESSQPQESSVEESSILEESSVQEESSVAEESSVPEESSREELPPPEEFVVSNPPIDMKYSELTAVPMEEGILPILEMPEVKEFPDIYCWWFKVDHGEQGNVSQLQTYMHNAAERKWDSFEIRQYMPGRAVQVYSSEETFEVQKTAIRFGYYNVGCLTSELDRYEEKMTAENGKLVYEAGWTLSGTQPFHYGEQVILEEDHLVQVAQKFLADFGMNSKIGKLVKQKNYIMDLTSDVKVTEQSQYAILQWQIVHSGAPVTGHYLTVEIINGQVVRMELDLPAIVGWERDEGQIFLSAQQAMYCMNYTRSLVGEDSELYQYSNLEGMRFVWVETDKLEPAWEMTFTTVLGEEKIVYVSALDAEVWWQGMEGEYPRAYEEFIQEYPGPTPEELNQLQVESAQEAEPFYTIVEPWDNHNFTPFTMPENTTEKFPILCNWQYQGAGKREEEFDILAQQAAEALWDKYTVKTEYAGAALDRVTYTSEVQEAEDGQYQEEIMVYDNRLKYEVKWLNAETIVSGNPQEIAVILDTVKEYMRVLGIDQYIVGDPTIKEELITIKDAEYQNVTLQWFVRINENGSKSEVKNVGLEIEVQNGRMVSLLFHLPSMEKMQIAETPSNLISAEEALYCLNYAKSYSVYNEYTIFGVLPELLEVRPTLTLLIDYPEYESSGYAWEFIFKRITEEGGRIYEDGTYSMYVDARTGDIHARSRKDGTYLSPYH